MFEFHSWVTIQEGWCESQDDETLLAANVKEIRSEAERLLVDTFGCSADVAVANGLHRPTIHGFRNHAQSWVLELFRRTGQIARGSYGVLYIRDDEDPDHSNEFQVWVMVRGEVEKKEDALLSPCLPKLEE